MNPNEAQLTKPSAAEFNPFEQGDIDPGFMAGFQAMHQVETLAHDPSLSAEQQIEKNEKIVSAIGIMSLATESLDYDTMKAQTEANNYRAYAANMTQQQVSEGLLFGNGPEDDSNSSDDEPRARRKTLVLAGAR